MRESAASKAGRYLIEGRLVLTTVTADEAHASVRGEGRFYSTGFSDGSWSCSCPARSDRCCHLIALRRIVAVDFEGGLPEQPHPTTQETP